MSEATKTLKVVKGSRYYKVNKYLTFVATMTSIPEYGVRVNSPVIGQWWFAGNRVNLPSLEHGQRFNLHRGNPTRYITIEVL